MAGWGGWDHYGSKAWGPSSEVFGGTLEGGIGERGKGGEGGDEMGGYGVGEWGRGIWVHMGCI